uniref:(California timema) hypothetical protein n=1 Tax=Timema californicum TaxID=61474 RepID=A0A7R9JCJ1_TIMCA|nr:unnamed protein product [Timema californicum]
MHEMGRYDIPAMIDLVLRVTQLARLFVVAHSTGATSTYIMASIRSEYISKMILLVAIAPVGPAPHLDTTAKDEAGRLGKKMLVS